MKEKISVIVPAFNEQEGIAKTVKEAIQFADEVVVVDDGSSDNTLGIAKKLARESRKVKVIRHEKNSGKVQALRTGVKNATGSIIVFTDADFTYPAFEIPKMVQAIKNGAFLVIGSRFKGGVKNMPRLNAFGNCILSFITSYVCCIEITDGQSGFRAFRKKDFEELNVKAKSLEFETKMTVKAAKAGHKVVEIPIDYRSRAGKSKLNPVKDGFKMLFALLRIAVKESSTISKAIIAPSIILLLVAAYVGIEAMNDIVTHYPRGEMLVHPYYPLLTIFLIIIAVQLISFAFLIDYFSKKLNRIEEKLNE